MLKIGVIIISISVNKCCNHDKIAISPIFKMAAAAILDFEKKAMVGAWHHPDLISRGSEDSKTVLISNTCFFKGVKSGFHLTIRRKHRFLSTCSRSVRPVPPHALRQWQSPNDHIWHHHILNGDVSQRLLDFCSLRHTFDISTRCCDIMR